ncbi:SDR family NAD(P)-dependent oxidoreductase, partial [Escherichia fergusonii]
MRLENKVALVTGGASGFGAAIARHFVDEGAKVVIVDLNGEGAARVAANTGGAVSLAGDVSKRDDIDRA